MYCGGQARPGSHMAAQAYGRTCRQRLPPAYEPQEGKLTALQKQQQLHIVVFASSIECHAVPWLQLPAGGRAAMTCYAV